MSSTNEAACNDSVNSWLNTLQVEITELGFETIKAINKIDSVNSIVDVSLQKGDGYSSRYEVNELTGITRYMLFPCTIPNTRFDEVLKLINRLNGNTRSGRFCFCEVDSSGNPVQIVIEQRFEMVGLKPTNNQLAMFLCISAMGLELWTRPLDEVISTKQSAEAVFRKHVFGESLEGDEIDAKALDAAA